MGDGEIHLKGPKLSRRAFDCTSREHEEFPHQEIPEIPQVIHFPPHNYWEQLRIRALKSLGIKQQRQGRDMKELKKHH